MGTLVKHDDGQEIACLHDFDIKKALEITGWMSEEELTWLAKRAKECKIIVEFGCFMGRSTRALADNTDGIIYAVDPWNGNYQGNINTYVLPEFKKNLSDHIESGKVIPVRNFSVNFELKDKVDLVFIDGDHSYKGVINDLKKGIDLLRIDGILCGHDYANPVIPEVKKAINDSLLLEGVVDTIWWTRKY